MNIFLKPLHLACPLLLVTGCAPLPTKQASDRSLALAQGACGGCHAVERYGVSPNPIAPPFAAIVNQQGLTRETLGTWLRDAHNYPEEMDFYLRDNEVEMLVDHMLTLRDPAYRPAI